MCKRVVVLCVMAAIVAQAAVVAADLNWTGAVSSDWGTAGNWSPAQVPGAGDHVVIQSGNVVLPPTATFGSMDWNGGTVSGPLTVAEGGTLMIGGSGDKSLQGPLTNAGTVVWTGTGNVSMLDNGDAYKGSIYNQAGGLSDIQNDQVLHNGYATPVVHNAGTLRRSGGAGTTWVNVGLDNSGVVEVQSGKIVLQGGGALGGEFVTDAGAALELGAGVFTEQGVPVFGGEGSSQMVGGTLVLTSDAIENLPLKAGSVQLADTFQGGSITNLTLSGATLAGTNEVTGVLNWNGGTVSGPLTVAEGGTLMIGGSGDKSLQGPLTNAGTVVWTGTGNVSMLDNGDAYKGSIYNQAGGLIDIQNDQVLHNGYATPVVHNAGTLRKSGGAGTTWVNVGLDNSGVVEVQSGILAVQGGYISGAASELRLGVTSTGAVNSHGRVSFAAPVTLQGRVAVALAEGVRPTWGTTLQLISGGPVLLPPITDFDAGNGFVAQFLSVGNSVSAVLRPAEVVLLTLTRPVSGMLDLHVEGTPGRVYRVEEGGALGSTEWSTIWTTNSVDGIFDLSTVYSEDASEQRFFRVSSP